MSQSKEQVVEPTNKAQEYVKRLQELDKECGYTKVAVPAYKMRDDGTWSLILQYQITELPKEKTE